MRLVVSSRTSLYKTKGINKVPSVKRTEGLCNLPTYLHTYVCSHHPSPAARYTCAVHTTHTVCDLHGITPTTCSWTPSLVCRLAVFRQGRRFLLRHLTIHVHTRCDGGRIRVQLVRGIPAIFIEFNPFLALSTCYLEEVPFNLIFAPHLC